MLWIAIVFKLRGAVLMTKERSVILGLPTKSPVSLNGVNRADLQVIRPEVTILPDNPVQPSTGKQVP